MCRGRTKGAPFADLVVKHKLSFGAVTGLEHESEELSANRTILSPEVRWWNPRDVYPIAEIFTSVLEDPAVLKRSYAHFHGGLPAGFPDVRGFAGACVAGSEGLYPRCHCEVHRGDCATSSRNPEAQNSCQQLWVGSVPQRHGALEKTESGNYEQPGHGRPLE